MRPRSEPSTSSTVQPRPLTGSQSSLPSQENAGATRFRSSESHSSVSVICHLPAMRILVPPGSAAVERRGHVACRQVPTPARLLAKKPSSRDAMPEDCKLAARRHGHDDLDLGRRL